MKHPEQYSCHQEAQIKVLYPHSDGTTCRLTHLSNDELLSEMKHYGNKVGEIMENTKEDSNGNPIVTREMAPAIQASMLPFEHLNNELKNRLFKGIVVTEAQAQEAKANFDPEEDTEPDVEEMLEELQGLLGQLGLEARPKEEHSCMGCGVPMCAPTPEVVGIDLSAKNGQKNEIVKALMQLANA